MKKYKRMAVPTIIIGDAKVLGFAQNQGYIEELLGLGAPVKD